jgi:hypothetical protein
MVACVSNQGLKKPFAFEKRKDIVLKFQAFKELICLLTSVFYSSDCKWIVGLT